MTHKPLDYLPPAFVAIVCTFWAVAPQAWVDSPWTIVIAATAVPLLVQAIEAVAERHEGWRMNRREFLTDLGYVIFNTFVIGWLTTHLAEDPLRSAKAALGITTHWAMHLPFPAQVALVVVVIEFGQYLMHRAMHNTWLWYTHAPHHHLTQLNAMKGAVGNPVELFLISLSIVALFDLPTAAVLCGVNVMIVTSVFAHANVNADPPPFYSFFFTTIRHHSLHHSTGYDETRSNYANSLILLDRLFGTYREGEGVIVGQDERRRLSVREQTLFPLRPVLDRMKAARASRRSATAN
ncbi:MAG: sterol desaturase family protein [Sphingomonas adhaesiva]|uniref:sterol desaturase family protein n=1 Tax=Sphingomonas adhaesiva TaxID=28212 RepID=UPI002FFC5638